MDTRLTVSRLSYVVRGDALVHDVTLVSAAGACTALLGANGAGKTTLLRLCHGLVEPSGGEIRWGESRPRELLEGKGGGRIAMVFQKPCLLRRSARENVEYALDLRRLPTAERDRRVAASLDGVGLAHCAGRNAHLLSGGEQQRLAVARACALEPDVILLDEPTAKLDVESTALVEEAIGDLKRRGVKVVLTSHNLTQVQRLCDDVILLDRGRLVVHASRNEFFDRARNRNEPGDKALCDFIRLQPSF